jgi:drug/metabolite transporter (DMT)-like permease
VIGLFSSAIIVGEQLTTPVLTGVAMILLGVGLNIVEDRRQASPPLA